MDNILGKKEQKIINSHIRLFGLFSWWYKLVLFISTFGMIGFFLILWGMGSADEKFAEWGWDFSFGEMLDSIVHTVGPWLQETLFY